MGSRKYVPKTFSEIEKLSEKELRKYYTTVRDVFQKQIKRYAQSSPEKAKIYQQGGYRYFRTLTELKTNPPKYLIGQSPEVLRRDLVRMAQELTELTPRRDVKTGYFETSAGLFIPSIQYQRQRKREQQEALVEALQNAGYEHISKSTLKNFGNFMDAMREQYGKKLPNSIIIAEFFDSLKYNTKRKATSDLLSLWEDFKRNGYKPDSGNVSLFAT